VEFPQYPSGQFDLFTQDEETGFTKGKIFVQAQPFEEKLSSAPGGQIVKQVE